MTDQVQTPEVPETAPTPVSTAPSKRQMGFQILEDGSIRAEFGEGVEVISFNPADVPEAIHAAAMTEGIISRLRGYTSKLTDKDRTPESLRAAIAKGVENLKNGVWKIERAPGEGTADYPMEVEAAYIFRKMRAAAKNEEFTETLPQCAEAFAKLTEEQVKTLKALSRYQLALAEVKADRAAKKKAALQAKIDKEGDDSGF